MPKRKSRVPTYRLHKSKGQGVVTLNGKDFYFGPYDDPASRERYDEKVQRWLANGRRLPEEAPTLTVSELILKFYRFCENLYGSRRNAGKTLGHIRVALSGLRGLYGSTPAASFGPKALRTVRQRFIDGGWERRTEKGKVVTSEPLSRNSVNDAVVILKRMVRWGAEEELIPGSCWHAVSAVAGLRAGQSAAPEPVTVRPVRDEHVDAILPDVLPPVKAMIELQRLNGMRPGEVTIMRGRDLDMTGELWVYRPEHHKGEHRGLDREVYIGQRGQEIVKPFLRTNVDEYLFRPDEACVELRKRERGENWKSHHQARSERRLRDGHRRPPKDHYSVNSYRRAIWRACEKAEVPRWSPHQLRHLAATKIHKMFGAEAARVTLGHKHLAVTEIYLERDQAVAATVAKKVG